MKRRNLALVVASGALIGCMPDVTTSKGHWSWGVDDGEVSGAYEPPAPTYAPVGPPPEFGSTTTEEGFRGLLAMDAYTKVRDKTPYPAVLLTHGINDPRVEPWQSAKYAARLQAASSSGRPVWLRVEYDAGHGFGSTKRQRNEETADTYAFLFRELRPEARKAQ